MKKLLPILLPILVLGSSVGCTSTVFKEPLVLSTKARAARTAKPIRQISVEKCDTVVLIVPVVHDPSEALEELLEQSRRAGGNVVIDFQTRSTSSSSLIPVYSHDCVEYTAMAAIVSEEPTAVEAVEAPDKP